MSSKMIPIPIACWGENNTLDLEMPDDWSVRVCEMKGHDARPLTDKQIRKALSNPMGTTPLRELALGKQQVVILFDDLIRPTPAYRVVPFVIEELHQAGIEDDQIRFIAAIGTHAPMTRAEMVKKLGANIVETYPVYNHNIYDNVVEVGRTSFGTPVFINREVASCDFKMGIGGVIPYYAQHVYNGGGKIILPGVSGMKTIYDYHVSFHDRMKNQPVPTEIKEGIPPYRLNLEEAAMLAGLDMKVDLVQNNNKEIVAMFAGDFIQTHRRATEVARNHYTTAIAEPSDIVILNTYPKEDQPLKCLWFAIRSVKPGGDIVVVSHSENGLSHNHYLFGRFGTDYGGPGWSPGRHFQIGEAGRVIFFTPHLSKYDMNNYIGDHIYFCKTWEQVINILAEGRAKHPSVAVYPYGGIQMPTE